MKYKITVNSVAEELLGAKQKSYIGNDLGQLLEKAVGKKKCNRYIPAQNPLIGGEKEGNINMVLNPDEAEREKRQYAPIVRVQVVP